MSMSLYPESGHVQALGDFWRQLRTLHFTRLQVSLLAQSGPCFGLYNS
jgi:hypothetical protein